MPLHITQDKPNQVRDDLIRSQQQLRESESQCRALIDQAADAILVTDSAGWIVDANQVACELTRYPREELLQRSIADTYCVDERHAALNRINSLAPGDRLVDERRLRRRDGSEVMVEISLKRLVDGRVQGIIRDTSERNRVADRLRWLTAATEQSPAAVIMTDTNGVIRYVNPGFCAMTGYSPDEVIGQTPRLLQSGLTPSTTYAALWATISSGEIWRGELCNRRKDGQLYWHSASIAPIKDADGQVRRFVAVQQDITARIHAEAALRERETRLRRLIESNILGMAYWEASGAISDANDEYLRIVGYSREDLATGQVDFRKMTPPEFVSADLKALEEMAAGRPVIPWEKELIRKDGRRVPVVTGVAPLSDSRDAGVVFLLDITDRRALERQFRQAQKMEAVGRLAGGVAHDFNNILTAITGYSELLQQDLLPGHPALADVLEIRKAAGRAVALTRQLLAFSRQQVLEPRVLDPNDLVRNVEKLLRRLVGDDITIVTRLDPALGLVNADPGQLEQVLVNLAVNARDSMLSHGTLTIETGNVDVDAAFAFAHTGLAQGRYVTVAVSDTGAGMDPATRARLFEPFFTTKERGKGTGLGLSTVYGIVKQSGGFIDVVSEPGCGATFTVYLTRVSGNAEPSVPVPAQPPIQKGSATVLVADDDAGVRDVVRETLSRYGYTVLVARTGAEALRMAATHAGSIHLLLTDVVMPELNGRELADRLVAVRPDLRVLFMSGYTDDEVLRRGIVDRRSLYIRKPFTSDALVRRVQLSLEINP